MGETNSVYMEADRNPHDYCGVVGVWMPANEAGTAERTDTGPGVGQLTLAGMIGVQHRGYDGAGLYVIDPDHGIPFMGTKTDGRITDKLASEAKLLDNVMPGSRIGVGHTRYGTNTSGGFGSVQPYSHDIVVAHNGHIEEVPGIKPGQGDSEALAMELRALSAQSNGSQGSPEDVVQALHKIGPILEGAFSLVIGTHGQLIGVRDPQGFRPLMVGYFEARGGFMFASEVSALKNAGATYVRDLEPGEVMAISDHGVQSTLLDRPQSPHGGLCIMEDAYFARADGTLEGRDVYGIRKAMGAMLAEEHAVAADAVVAVPESGRPAAAGYAEVSGLPRVDGITLNRDSNTRSFMQSTTEGRRAAVAAKMLIMTSEVRGRRLIVSDDTIVRGNTLSVLVEMLRAAGATAVHLRIPSAPLLNACYQGIDIGRAETLLAHRLRSMEKMAKHLGADSLGHLSVAGMMRAIESVPVSQGPARLQHLTPRPLRAQPQAVQRCTTCMGGRRAITVPGDFTTPLLPELTH
jgi:amidophosphoribosyltransferase